MAQNTDAPFIFISYSHLDGPKVIPIVHALRDRDFEVWYDSGIEAGTEWPTYIATQLQKAACVIAFISPNAERSQFCRREITYAINYNKPLLAVYLEDFKPEPGLDWQLSTLQSMFLHRSPSTEVFLDQLARAQILQSCKKAAAGKVAPAPKSEPVPIPPLPEQEYDEKLNPEYVRGLLSPEAAEHLIQTFPDQFLSEEKASPEPKSEPASKPEPKSAPKPEPKSAPKPAAKPAPKEEPETATKGQKRFFALATNLLHLSYGPIGGITFGIFSGMNLGFFPLVGLCCVPLILITLVVKILYLTLGKKIALSYRKNVSFGNDMSWLAALVVSVIWASFTLTISPYYILNLLCSIGLHLIPGFVTSALLLFYT